MCRAVILTSQLLSTVHIGRQVPQFNVIHLPVWCTRGASGACDGRRTCSNTPPCAICTSRNVCASHADVVPLHMPVESSCRWHALPCAVQAELLRFQADLDERRLPRDGVIAFVQELRNRKLLEPWPLLTPDVEVGWRYPPAEYLREEVRGVRPTNATTNTSNTTTNATTNTNTTSSSSREDPGSSGRSSASGGDVGGEGDGGSGKSWKGRPGFGGYQGQDEEEYLDWEDDDGEVGVFGLEGGEFGLGMDGALSGGGGGGGAGAGQGSELDVMMASFAGGGVGRGGDGDVVRGGEGRTAWGGEGQLGS